MYGNEHVTIYMEDTNHIPHDAIKNEEQYLTFHMDDTIDHKHHNTVFEEVYDLLLIWMILFI